MRKLLVALFLVVAGGLAYAGTEKYLQDGPDLGICTRALDLLSKNDVAGFDVLSENWIDGSEESRAQLAEFVDVHFRSLQRKTKSLGNPCGIELIHVEEAGRTVRRYCYLCKYELGWVRWRFTFYRPTAKWSLYGCHFDMDEHVLFAECGRCLLHADSGETSVAQQPQATSSR